jgi:cation transport ATPase
MHAHVEAPVAKAADGGAAISKFAVTGMNCNNCARHVTEAIQGVPGVTGVDVRLEEGRATVRWQPGAVVQLENVVRAVKAAGYEARRSEAQPDLPRYAGGHREVHHDFRRGATLPLIVGEWVFGWGCKTGSSGSASLARLRSWSSAARFFRGAWNQLKRGGSNMDTRALGSSTAFGYSLGTARRLARPSLFHGSRHHHTHQRRAFRESVERAGASLRS